MPLLSYRVSFRLPRTVCWRRPRDRGPWQLWRTQLCDGRGAVCDV